MMQSRPHKRPGNLFLSFNRQPLSETKAPGALLPYGRDAFLPCRTATSATFFQNLTFAPPSASDQCESSSDSSDDEDKRNTIDLLTGAFFNNDIIIQTDASDQHLPFNVLNSAIFDLDLIVGPTPSPEQQLHALPPTPANAKLLVNAYRQFAEDHNGIYPKVGAFVEKSETRDEEEDVVVLMYTDDCHDPETSDAIIAEQEAPLIHSPEQPREEEGAEEEETSTLGQVQQEQDETRTSPSPVYGDGDDEGDDGDDDCNMSDSSGKDDDDDGSDDDFVDPTYSTFYNQQRRTLAQFEKKPSTPSQTKTQTHPPVARKTIPLPANYKSSASASSASSSPKPSPKPVAPPPTPSSASPSSQKRKGRPSGSGGSSSASNSGGEEDSDSRNSSKMYAVIREKTGKASYQCNLCPDVRTKAFGDMKRHLESLRHKTPSHKCDPEMFGFGCGKVFTRNDALKRHMLSQHPIHWAIYEAENHGLSRKRARV